MAAKIDIVAGFLGAGKTTLINKLLEHIVDFEKVAIVENEFGDVSIDGQVLKKYGIKVKELSSGCICCTLFGDFISSTVKLLSQYQLDRVVVEPTGVGRLSDVLKACKSIEKVKNVKINMVITVIDCLKYKMYSHMFGDFFRDTVQYAKTILLSRTQLSNEKNIKSVVREIRKINREADIITKNWDWLSARDILLIGSEDRNDAIIKTIVDCARNHHNENAFQVWNRTTAFKYSQGQLSRLLDRLKDEAVFGTILRAKGIVRSTDSGWFQFDYVPNEICINDIDCQGNGRIIVIGKDFDKTALDHLFFPAS